MQPDKAQLDTIELYLRTLVSKEKTSELMERVKQLEEPQAQQVVMLFEQRANPRLADVEKFLNKTK